MNQVIPAAPVAVEGTDPASERSALMTIRVAPDPLLRRRARHVGPEDAAAVRLLVPRMLQTMYAAPGIGLAAPQVGLDLRVAVLDLAEDQHRAPLVLVNPEVVAEGEALLAREEGCLSLPGQYAEVVRPAQVRVRYRDLDGATHELDADGLLATCLQHEIDHLDGVLFVDHISALKRNMIMRRLAKEQKGKGASRSSG